MVTKLRLLAISPYEDYHCSWLKRSSEVGQNVCLWLCPSSQEPELDIFNPPTGIQTL